MFLEITAFRNGGLCFIPFLNCFHGSCCTTELLFLKFLFSLRIAVDLSPGPNKNAQSGKRQKKKKNGGETAGPDIEMAEVEPAAEPGSSDLPLQS